jgi:hypothetical protein
MYANAMVATPRLSESIAPITSLTGWSSPQYAQSWNDVVQIVYARSNFNENSRRGNDRIQYEYVTKSDVGAVLDAYRTTRGNKTSSGYNPTNASSLGNTVVALQRQLGSKAPSVDKIRIVLREFYNAVFGTPQMIPPSWYTAGNDYSSLTESQRQALAQNRQSGELAQQKQDAECGFFCSIRKTVLNFIQLPGNVAGGVSTAAKIMSVAIPVVVIGGTVWALWVVGRKVLELDSTEVASTVGSRGLNKVVGGQ